MLNNTITKNIDVINFFDDNNVWKICGLSTPVKYGQKNHVKHLEKIGNIVFHNQHSPKVTFNNVAKFLAKIFIN